MDNYRNQLKITRAVEQFGAGEGQGTKEKDSGCLLSAFTCSLLVVVCPCERGGCLNPGLWVPCPFKTSPQQGQPEKPSSGCVGVVLEGKEWGGGLCGNKAPGSSPGLSQVARLAPYSTGEALRTYKHSFCKRSSELHSQSCTDTMPHLTPAGRGLEVTPLTNMGVGGEDL